MSKQWGRFAPVSTQIPYRLIWRSYGPEKSGKSHLGLSAPGPIAIQSFDIGLEGVVEKFTKQGKDIRYTKYEFDKNDCSQAAAKTIRDRFVEDFSTVLEPISASEARETSRKTGESRARTVIWDTETELWEVFRYAEFGDISDAPKSYVGLNARYRDLIQRAYNANVNLQLIQKVKERWGVVKKEKRDGSTVDSPYPTGIFEPTGFKEAGYIVQANLEHRWVKDQGFIVKVLNCRQNMNIAGGEFENIEFAELGQLVFPETSEEQWT